MPPGLGGGVLLPKLLERLLDAALPDEGFGRLVRPEQTALFPAVTSLSLQRMIRGTR